MQRFKVKFDPSIDSIETMGPCFGLTQRLAVMEISSFMPDQQPAAESFELSMHVGGPGKGPTYLTIVLLAISDSRGRQTTRKKSLSTGSLAEQTKSKINLEGNMSVSESEQVDVYERAEEIPKVSSPSPPFSLLSALPPSFFLIINDIN